MAAIEIEPQDKALLNREKDRNHPSIIFLDFS